MIGGPTAKWYITGQFEMEKNPLHWNSTAKHIKLGFEADIKIPGHVFFGGSGYFGVGEWPQFFYASMTALTLGKIGRLLGFTFPLPPPIAQTGFPEVAEDESTILGWSIYASCQAIRYGFYRGLHGAVGNFSLLSAQLDQDSNGAASTKESFLDLIKAELFGSASYSFSFVGAQFYVRVTVDLSGINT
ncbi:hypothetical protein OS493_004764 [Desmophyllum pertusum]|uniref:Uncharacterized protein n=1 Tax=Desmophyllum pertusum TaxID=174260 RepID=A0A9X0CZD2_9CNID|nr:hypothetical protein OS493_004764 [Desmophyllum pertusum]